MWRLKEASPVCSLNQHCSQWAWTYLKYCLCSTRDAVALTLGLVSVLSWGVAEVPQIMTNYREKSTEGLSVAFLMTWIVGDLFNLIGCWLEPATLPTQFYMALLYTVTTVVLTTQTVYYSHIYPQLKDNKLGLLHKVASFDSLPMLPDPSSVFFTGSTLWRFNHSCVLPPVCQLPRVQGDPGEVRWVCLCSRVSCCNCTTGPDNGVQPGGMSLSMDAAH